MTITDELLYMR